MIFFLIWLALTFFTLTLLWLLFFPEKRDSLFYKLRLKCLLIKKNAFPSATEIKEKKPIQSSGFLSNASHYINESFGAIAVISIILILPSIIIITFRHSVILEGYNTNLNLNTNTASLIASLMRGEQLAPPPPLPPEVFITAEVELAKPNLALNLANRNWDELNPEFRQRLLAVFKIMQEKYGYHMVMIEGYRSPERQDYLANQGGHITNARAGQSYHQHGLAADSAFYRNGKLIISEKDPWAMRGYELYGETAKEAGLVWGGSWKTIKDLGHVELRKH